jgi:hypothetical protein
MAEVVQDYINKVYTSDNKGGLEDITRVICVLMPDSFTICGLNEKNNVLLINQFDTEQQWNLDFYKARLSNRSFEPLLRKTTAVFVDTNKEMLVPKSLYNELESEKWFRNVHFMGADEIVTSVQLRDKAFYMYTIGTEVKSLLSDHLPKAKLLPIAAYQFHKQAKADNIAECCLSDDKAYVTLYKDRVLHWHSVFSYTSAEDIAYQVKLICKEQHIREEELVFECAAINNDLTNVITKLSEYFPNLEGGMNHNIVKDEAWANTAYLLQQLSACV